MIKCKITVLIRSFNKDLIEEYVQQEKNILIACCTDGTRPVYFKIEKIYV
jgi:uncharacterized repeat protein (TIGR04076 family)